ncbi:ABC-F family ATP-binding cassette domain-containing protein [Candidatus Levibacter sp. Uisw_134_01]|uniref:ABC-F family ATP-binding cassette domain-containing protein n=1 Tax=Candidatus Levibacter sp. Uisw_134_01 TaxID=3230999 RepID=UPI003D52455F
MPTPLITTHNLKISQPNKVIINNAEFSINRFDRIILVGKNGCGKSSLLKVLKGIDTPDEGQIWMAPNIKIDLLEQNPAIPNANNVIDFLSQDNNHLNLSKINFIIEQLGLSDIDLTKKISGGELRKIYLAQSILNEPDIMLLDEPTNHIDLPTINWLEKKLIELNTTMIIVSHDQEFLKKIGTKTLWFNKGELIKREGPYDDFFKWTRELIDIEKHKLHKIKQKIKSETKWSIEGISGRRKRNMGRVRELEKLNNNYENNKISDSKPIDISLNKTNDSSVNIVETFNVFFMYKNTPTQENVITNFNYKIRRNDRIGIIGANGSGKTTLIKILQGIYKPTKGKVKIGERVNVKYFDQNKELIKLDSTPWKTLINEGDHVEFLGKKIHVLSYLKKFLFDEKKSLQNNSTLSGGEKVRLLLAKLFLNNHNFLILDEPTNDLDFETLKLLKENISNYDGTVLVISHDRYFLDHTVNKLLVFENDNQIFQHEGNFTEYFKKYGLSKLIKSNTKNINSNKVSIKTYIKPIKILKKKLTFRENYNLKALPDKIEKLEIKLKKSETILDNNELYYNDKITFDKTLVEITNIKKEISLAEDELLDLQILQDEINSK